MSAIATAGAHETISQDAAFQIAAELSLDAIGHIKALVIQVAFQPGLVKGQAPMWHLEDLPVFVDRPGGVHAHPTLSFF